MKYLTTLIAFIFTVTCFADNVDTNAPAINPIAKGITSFTTWINVKNPFRFEIQTTHHDVEKFEQMEVTGLTKMPDEDNILQTYAFVIKTSQNAPAKTDKQTAESKQDSETIVLKAFPQILSSSTSPTIEDAEHSSISLTRQQLWFIGAMPATNGDRIAIFWQASTYPVKKSDLRYFDLTDATIKALNVRDTTLGEKVSLTKDADLLARFNRLKTTNNVDQSSSPLDSTPSTNSPTLTGTNSSAIIGPLPTNSIASPQPSGDPVKDVKAILE